MSSLVQLSSSVELSSSVPSSSWLSSFFSAHVRPRRGSAHMEQHACRRRHRDDDDDGRRPDQWRPAPAQVLGTGSSGASSVGRLMVFVGGHRSRMCRASCSGVDDRSRGLIP